MGYHSFHIALAALGVSGLVVPAAAAQSAEWNAREAVRNSFLQDQPASLSQPATDVAISAMSVSSGLSPALTALGGTSVASTPLGTAGAIEVRVYDPHEASIANLMFSADAIADRALLHHRGDAASSLSVGYVAAYDAAGGEGALDFGIRPRAAFSFGPDGTAAGAGAEVRLGQYLGGATDQRPSWYVFAGAERSALLYDPRAGFNMRDAMSLQPYAVVGDAQAGVAMSFGSADLSLAYVRREREYTLGTDGYDAHEDFAAVSVSRRW